MEKHHAAMYRGGTISILAALGADLPGAVRCCPVTVNPASGRRQPARARRPASRRAHETPVIRTPARAATTSPPGTTRPAGQHPRNCPRVGERTANFALALCSSRDVPEREPAAGTSSRVFPEELWCRLPRAGPARAAF